MIENPFRPLIMGLVSGMTLQQVQPFFLSLEKSGYRGDVAMVVSDLDAATQAFLRARRVQLIPFQKAGLKRFSAGVARLPGYFLSRQKRRLFERQLAPAYLHHHCARHFFCEDFLQECGGHYTHVMLADTRDILFQNDPFAFDVPDGLSVFLEDLTKTIGACKFNSSGMLRVFGKKILRELGDQPIACAGTIIGTAAAIREHLARMNRILLQQKDRKTIDQPVHNYLVYKKPPAKLHRFANFAGPVLTMVYIEPERLQFNDRGQLINPDGSVINTLHQYDRHHELAPKLLKALT
jgi:hypothetical protein